MATVAEEVVYRITGDDKSLVDAVERAKRAVRGLEETTNGIKFKNLEAAWDQLGVRSTEAIDKSRLRVISAYDAIAKSGTASSDTLKRAHAAMDENLKRLGNEQLSGVQGAFSKVEQGMASMASRAGALGGAFGSLGSAMSALGPIGIALTATMATVGLGFKMVADNAVEQFKEMRALQAVTGTTLEETDKLASSFQALGFDGSHLTRSLGQLAQEIDSGGKALDRLGVSIRDESGGLKTAGDLFLEVRDRISQMSSTSRQAAAVQDLFGRGGRELLPIFQMTSAEYARMAEKAAAYSEWTEKNQAATRAYVEAVEELKMRWQGFLNTMTPVLELFTKLVTAVTSVSDALRNMPVPNRGTFDPRLGRDVGPATGDVGAISPGPGGLPEGSATVAESLRTSPPGDRRLGDTEVADAIARMQTATNLRLAKIQTVSSTIEAQARTGEITERQAVERELANLKQRESAVRAFAAVKIATLEQAAKRDQDAIDAAKAEELIALEQITQTRTNLGARGVLAAEAEIAVTVNSMAEQGRAVAQSMDAVTELRRSTAQQINAIELTVTEAFERNQDIQTQAAIEAAEKQLKTSADLETAITEIMRIDVAKRKQFREQQERDEVAGYTRAQETILQLTETESERLSREYRKRREDLEASLRGLDMPEKMPDLERAMAFKLVGVDQARESLQALQAQMGKLGEDARFEAMAARWRAALGELTPEIEAAIRELAKLQDMAATGAAGDELAKSLKVNATLAQLLGKEFDLAASNLHAVTLAMQKLAQEGIDPLDPRLVQLKQRFEALRDLKMLENDMRDLFGGVGNSVAQALQETRDGTKSTTEAFRDMTRAIVNDIANNLIAKGINRAIEALIVMAIKAVEAQQAADLAAGGSGGVAKAIFGVVGGLVGSYFGGGFGGGTGGNLVPAGAGAYSAGGYAEGGVVDRPTVALIGEAGPELVLTGTDQRALAKMLPDASADPHDLLRLIRDPGTAPEIPAFADGGVVSQPTLAVVGEAGPELVLNGADQRALAVMLNAPSSEPFSLMRLIRAPGDTGTTATPPGGESLLQTVNSTTLSSMAMNSWAEHTSLSSNTSTTSGPLDAMRDLIVNSGAPGIAPKIPAYAAGGIVSGPTLALIGEAGPEAVVPLKEKGAMPWADGRSGGGYSGPLVTVEVINNADATVREERTAGPNGEEQVRVYVEKIVESGLGNGRFDRVMRGSYGTSRRGLRL